eukprot:TRINITY_DN2220_c1_g2_i1.p1 TRINITY_DN2220_c1_g2~~TRINITY_DN2220_c1_g2_i1.p1  ORF type:complete len:382 (-),score=62.93 TRINITY_DN2220_c1_g2_i1:10-1155(-)
MEFDDKKSSNFTISHSNTIAPDITEEFDEEFLKTDEFSKIVLCFESLHKQRQRIINERDTLLQERESCLADPVKRVSSMPTASVEEIPQVPHIDFNKFNNLQDKDGPKKRKRKPETASKSRPGSYGRAWTPQEQQKLEFLLHKYPDESVSSHRWEKIARELGNRTPKQVASRVQKYFIKLVKAGLPVPGKLPNIEYYSKNKKQKTAQASLSTPTDPNKVTIHTTGIAYYEPPPVDMPLDGTLLPNMSVADANQLMNLQGTDEYWRLVEMMELRSKKNEVIVEKPSRSKGAREVVHMDCKCNSCGMEPIRGPRWKCLECPAYNPTNFCRDCWNIGWKSRDHSVNHSLEKIETVDAPYFVDGDYLDNDKEEDMSYLDPNFMPL